MGISETFREIREERIDSIYREREPQLPKKNAIDRASERLRELTAEMANQSVIASSACPTNPYDWGAESHIGDKLKIGAAVAALPVHHCSGTCKRKWHGRTVADVREALEVRVANGGLDTCTGRVIVSLAEELGIRPSDEALAVQAARVNEWHRARVAKAAERLRVLPEEIALARSALDHAHSMSDDTEEMRKAHREWSSDYSAALDCGDWTEDDDERLGDVIHGR